MLVYVAVTFHVDVYVSGDVRTLHGFMVAAAATTILIS